MLVEGNFGMNINEKDNRGDTPLKMARDGGHDDIVSFLESKGTKIFPSLTSIIDSLMKKFAF